MSTEAHIHGYPKDEALCNAYHVTSGSDVGVTDLIDQ